MKVTVLASGSKGNSTYIETSKTKILIDAGISFIQLKNRLLERGITLDTISAIFVSHEHSDHVRELASILKKTSAVLYIDKISYDVINNKTNNSLLPFKTIFIKNDCKYNFEDVFVVPIPLSHDSKVCHGFLIKEDSDQFNQTFASITDTGLIQEKYFQLLSSINTIMIESNHDVDMLVNSKRTWMLIQRILSKKGHLSNEECVQYLSKIVSKDTKNIILAHLSDECNDVNLALNEVYKTFGEKPSFNLFVADQYEPLPTIEVK